MKLVKIYWKDTTCYGDKAYLFRAKEAGLTLCTSVGELLHDDEEKIIVSHTSYIIPQQEEIMYSEYTVIPRGCVASVVELCEKEIVQNEVS